MTPRRIYRFPSSVRGLTLIEIMIALVLGLMVVGGALLVFISNRQTYRVADSLSRIQENSRVIFELMARDLRVAGGNPCQARLPMRNALNNQATAWWSRPNGTAGDFVEGFDGNEEFLLTNLFGTDPGDRIEGTDAIQVVAAVSEGLGVASHNRNSAVFTVHTADHGFDAGDIGMVCDFQNVAIFQVTAVAGNTLTHAATGLNTTKDLGPGGTAYRWGCFLGRVLSDNVTCDNDPDGDPARQWPAYLARLQGNRWFVGAASDGTGQSLYRTSIDPDGTDDVLEIAENVADFQLRYLVGNEYREPVDVADWSLVEAVRVELLLESAEPMAIGGDPAPLQREFVTTITLRSRIQ